MGFVTVLFCFVYAKFRSGHQMSHHLKNGRQTQRSGEAGSGSETNESTSRSRSTQAGKRDPTQSWLPTAGQLTYRTLHFADDRSKSQRLVILCTMEPSQEAYGIYQLTCLSKSRNNSRHTRKQVIIESTPADQRARHSSALPPTKSREVFTSAPAATAENRLMAENRALKAEIKDLKMQLANSRFKVD